MTHPTRQKSESRKRDHLSEFEPSSAEMELLIRRRSYRRHQRNSRGGHSSFQDQLENAAVLLALEAAEITEGQAARALKLDRVTVREIKLRLTALGRAIAYSL